VGALSDVGAFAQSFTALAAANPQIHAAASFWWTAGGEGFPSMALACRGLPDPFHYSTLLTGDLGRTASGIG
jgi:type VI secretion system protein ImpM